METKSACQAGCVHGTDEETENISVEIIRKYDYQLSNKEIKNIFLVYNECFYDNRITMNKLIRHNYNCIGKLKMWQWYLAKVDSDIIGIAAFCYSYNNAKNADIRPDKGENICSVGVLEKYRHLGIGRLLMNQIISDYKIIDLVVEIKRENENYKWLVEFYQSLQFEFISDENLVEENAFLIRKAE